MPTMAMREEDQDYAVSFALPADAEGIVYIMGRQSCDTRKLEEGMMDRGNILFGGHEALVVLDNVFVPWDRVFMYKEYEFAGQLVEKFAAYHRQSYACKVGVGDVLIGASQTAAEYNNVARASHVKDKLIEMNHLNETLYCGCIACASEGNKEPSGTHPLSLRHFTHRPGHCRRVDGDHAFGDGFGGAGNRQVAGKILYRQLRRADRQTYAHFEVD
jgi:4-hydroxybutyryl-CoA dehydratase/vinylacetyl-CoA-Delta-isomerase